MAFWQYSHIIKATSKFCSHAGVSNAWLSSVLYFALLQAYLKHVDAHKHSAKALFKADVP